MPVGQPAVFMVAEGLQSWSASSAVGILCGLTGLIPGSTSVLLVQQP